MLIHVGEYSGSLGAQTSSIVPYTWMCVGRGMIYLTRLVIVALPHFQKLDIMSTEPGLSFLLPTSQSPCTQRSYCRNDKLELVLCSSESSYFNRVEFESMRSLTKLNNKLNNELELSLR